MGGAPVANSSQEERAPVVRLKLLLDGPTGPEMIPVDKVPFVLGRLGDLRLIDGRVSRQHARIISVRGEYFIEDMNSSNGTLVNDRRLERPHPLVSGDLIRIGAVKIVAMVGDENSGTYVEVLHNQPATEQPTAKHPSAMTEKVQPLEYAQAPKRGRPTLQTDPGSTASARRTTSTASSSSAVLLCRMGNESLEIVMDRAVELDQLFSLGGLEVAGPASTVNYRNGGYWVDVRSDREGVAVNGQMVTGSVQLQPGDKLNIGPVELELRINK